MTTEQQREYALEKFYLELQDTFSFQMHRIMKAFFRHAGTLMQDDTNDLQKDHYPVLITIDNIQNLSQQEIADILMRDKSSVQRTITLLQRKGLLEVIQHPQDKRKNVVNITKEGHETALKCRQVLRQIDSLAFASFTVKERDEALQALHDLAEKLEKSASQLPPNQSLICQ